MSLSGLKQSLGNSEESKRMTNEEILKEIQSVPEPDRRDLFALIREYLCVHCGREHPSKYQECQCWNDD